MKAEDILALMVPATYLVMLGIEALFPAREFPKVRFWRLLGVLCLVLLMTLGTITPMLLPAAAAGRCDRSCATRARAGRP